MTRKKPMASRRKEKQKKEKKGEMKNDRE